MTAALQTVLVGVFESRSDAEAAVRDMKAFGIYEGNIGLVVRQGNGSDPVNPTPADSGTKAAEGAAVGAATGAGIGALWALGIAANMLPAIGPVVSGGLLAALLASAAGGAATAGLVGALVGLGIPEEEAAYYENQVKSGRTIVTVRAPEYAADMHEIIQRHNGVTTQATGIQ